MLAGHDCCAMTDRWYHRVCDCVEGEATATCIPEGGPGGEGAPSGVPPERQEQWRCAHGALLQTTLSQGRTMSGM